MRANISSFALLDPAVVAAALARLERDVADGTWAERNADLIAGDEADFGYRLLVAELRLTRRRRHDRKRDPHVGARP